MKAFQVFERQAMLRLDCIHAVECPMAMNTLGNNRFEKG